MQLLFGIIMVPELPGPVRELVNNNIAKYGGGGVDPAWIHCFASFYFVSLFMCYTSPR